MSDEPYKAPGTSEPIPRTARRLPVFVHDSLLFIVFLFVLFLLSALVMG